MRTPQGKYLDDEAAITYYSSLAASLGGRVSAYYLDGFAVYNQGKISTFMENDKTAKAGSFYLVEEISPVRHPGWPLDSVSINKNNGIFFTEEGNDRYEQETAEETMDYRKQLLAFLKKSLE